MQSAIELSQYDNYYISYGIPIKNTIVENSNYISIQYSNSFVTFNNICLHFSLRNFTIEDYFNKTKCQYEDHSINKDHIQRIIQIEREILDTYKHKTTGIPTYNLKEYLSMNNRIKLFTVGPNVKKGTTYSNGIFLLKISGIWETKESYGLIYKFFMV